MTHNNNNNNNHYFAWRAATCAALLLTAAACSNELEAPDATPIPQGEKITLIANLPGDDPQTRIGFDDPETGEVKLTWSEDDQFLAFSDIQDGTATIELFTLAGGGGSTSGNFTGKSPVASGEWVSFFYPSGSFTQDPDDNNLLTATTIGQTQTGNNNTAHLSDYHFMIGRTKDLTQPITFTNTSTLMRFDATLKDYDATVDGAPVKLTLSYANPLTTELEKGRGFSHAVNIGNFLSQYNNPNSVELLLKDVSLNSDNKLRAYLMVLWRFRVDTDNHLVVSVTCANGAVYQYNAPAPSANKEYEYGKRYYTACELTKVPADPNTVFGNDTQASASFSGGGGASADDPYVIGSAGDLKKLADGCLSNMGYKGKFFRLDADICVVTDDWKPIGNIDTNFKGTFDGNGHTISGKLAGKAPYFGFFGSLESAEIRNLHITAAVTNSSQSDSQYTGALVGCIPYAGATTGAKIIGCTNSGTVSAAATKVTYDSSTGGIVGMMYGSSVENCINRGKVIGQNTNGSSKAGSAGGIVGQSDGTCTMLNCRNYGEVTADEDGTYQYSSKGGIIGSAKISASDGTSTFADCTNYGTVTAAGASMQSYHSGGLIGVLIFENNSTCTIHNCINRGIVEPKVAGSGPTQYFGGLFGSFRGSGGTFNCVIGDCCADLRSELPALVGAFDPYGRSALDECTEGHIRRDSGKPFFIH